jgi:hypothetical protein
MVLGLDTFGSLGLAVMIEDLLDATRRLSATTARLDYIYLGGHTWLGSTDKSERCLRANMSRI